MFKACAGLVLACDGHVNADALSLSFYYMFNANVLIVGHVLFNALKPFVMMCRGPLSVHVYEYG